MFDDDDVLMGRPWRREGLQFSSNGYL